MPPQEVCCISQIQDIVICWGLGWGKKLLFSRTSSSLEIFSGVCKGLCRKRDVSGAFGEEYLPMLLLPTETVFSLCLKN